SSITCAFLLASDVPWPPCRAPELCGVTSTQPYHQRLDLSITKPNKDGRVPLGTNDQKTQTRPGRACRNGFGRARPGFLFGVTAPGRGIWPGGPAPVPAPAVFAAAVVPGRCGCVSPGR